MRRPAGIYLIVVHALGAAALAFVEWRWSLAALCVGMYYLRMFGITAGFHRLFAHRSYRTSRAVQFALAWLGTSALQRGPIWWAAAHRHHHRRSDTPDDLHSPRHHGLWHAHVGWVLAERNRHLNRSGLRDLTRYPELAWLDRHYLVPPMSLAVLVYAGGGVPGLVWGFLVSTILLWHGTFTINSLAHRIGTQRFATNDDSGNSFLLALLTMGEGWHNNHHFYPGSARQGFRWWELDMSYIVLRMLERVGLVWDLRAPPESLRVRATLPTAVS